MTTDRHELDVRAKPWTPSSSVRISQEIEFMGTSAPRLCNATRSTHVCTYSIRNQICKWITMNAAPRHPEYFYQLPNTSGQTRIGSRIWFVHDLSQQKKFHANFAESSDSGEKNEKCSPTKPANCYDAKSTDQADFYLVANETVTARQGTTTFKSTNC